MHYLSNVGYSAVHDRRLFRPNEDSIFSETDQSQKVAVFKVSNISDI